MAHLAVSLAQLGCKVTYVAESEMTADRTDQGWKAPELPGVKLEWASSDMAVRQLIQAAAPDSIHVCQGVRANGRVAVAQRVLTERGLRQWVVMETVDDSGWRGIVKRLEYGRLFRAQRNILQGVLTMGHQTADWVAARGVPSQRIFPFAYFLPKSPLTPRHLNRTHGPFRFLFVGRMITLKRVDWLINSLAALKCDSFELWLVGGGEDEPALRELANQNLDSRVRWLGSFPMLQVPSIMAQADCLVLPSIHDGWGAVASEALMVGTPVICSDACGVAGVVRASGVGGVFPVNNSAALHTLLDAQLTKGIVDYAARSSLKEWASCIGADAGAKYLQKILISPPEHQYKKIISPWE